MNEKLTDNIARKGLPFVAELVGPAGAGKTTLAQVLNQRSNRIRLGTLPYFRRIVHFPFFTGNALSLLPTLFHLYYNGNGRRLTPRETAWMVTLNGWHRVLGRQVSNSDMIIILDQGPIYMLAELYSFGPENLKSQNAKKWWNSVFKHWADTLSMVVWLDTSDGTLLERIRVRDKWHLMKGKSEPEVIKFLAHYRESYEQVISLLIASNDSLKVLAFDTARESLDRVVDKLLLEFGLKAHTT